MGIISKIILTDKRGFTFVIDNKVFDDSEEDFAIIEKSLKQIANGDNPELYTIERKKGIVYVSFVRKN